MADERERWLSGLKSWLGAPSTGVPPALAGAGMASEAEAMQRWLAEQERRRNLEQLRAAAERERNLRNPSPWSGEAELRNRYTPGYEGQDTGAGDQMIVTQPDWSVTRAFVPNPAQTQDRGFARPLRRRGYERI